MSMRDYAVDDYGLLLTEETSKIIAAKVVEEFDEDDDYGYILYNAGICEYIGNFTGQALSLSDDGFDNWDSDYYSDDQICYILTSSHSTLFKAAYKDMDELIAEFKSRVGKYLPEDFDYRSHIRHIVGTYYG